MASPLQIGLFNINNTVCSYPESIERVARAAEDAGFDSLWTGEHVVLPDPQVPPSPMPPEGRMLDPAVALAYAAAFTKRVKLGTGIIILPQRNPLVLAKELASVDVVSGGRLIFGVGVGYLKPEFDALGISMDDRGTKTLEYIEAMRAIWASERAAYQGTYVNYAGVSANPKPVQVGGPPVVMGGHTPAAWRKTITHCQGWYGFALDAAATEKNLAGLAAAKARYERPAGLGDVEISVTPRGRIDAAAVETFAALGVHRLVLIPRGNTVDEVLSYIDDIHSTLLS